MPAGGPGSTDEGFADRLAAVEERIAAACRAAGRAREEVTLVAVTKTRSDEEVLAAARCGLRDLGENRVEELEARREALCDALPADVRWHMIGHVQSRKAARAAAAAALVHSVDSVRLAERLDRAAQSLGRVLPVLLEMNVSGEESKDGFPAWDPASRQALPATLAPLEGLEHLEVRGLMTMAPLGAAPERAREVFAALRTLGEALCGVLPWIRGRELSMGMTDDFEPAIAEGATMVRIGRALFGPRTT
jgi:pyridoxal phosphate enzyme (YggS family)